MAYTVTYQVGALGAPANGATGLYNPLFAGRTPRIYREGLYQYKQGANKVINTGTGYLYFIPALTTGERLKIIIQ